MAGIFLRTLQTSSNESGHCLNLLTRVTVRILARSNSDTSQLVAMSKSSTSMTDIPYSFLAASSGFFSNWSMSRENCALRADSILCLFSTKKKNGKMIVTTSIQWKNYRKIWLFSAYAYNRWQQTNTHLNNKREYAPG